MRRRWHLSRLFGGATAAEAAQQRGVVRGGCGGGGGDGGTMVHKSHVHKSKLAQTRAQHGAQKTERRTHEAPRGKRKSEGGT